MSYFDKVIVVTSISGVCCSILFYFRQKELQEHYKMLSDISEGKKGPSHVKKAVKDAK